MSELICDKFCVILGRKKIFIQYSWFYYLFIKDLCNRLKRKEKKI